MNTRTYHRNSMLAFPKSAEYACALERPRRPKVIWWALGWGVAVYSLVVIARIFMGDV